MARVDVRGGWAPGWLATGGGHGKPAARDQALRPRAPSGAGTASEAARAPGPGSGVEADARLGAGRLREDDAAGRVARGVGGGRAGRRTGGGVAFARPR